MDKNQILKMLQDQVHAKADPETIEKLRNVKSPKDALPILENLSIDLAKKPLAKNIASLGFPDLATMKQDVILVHRCSCLQIRFFLFYHYLLQAQ